MAQVSGLMKSDLLLSCNLFGVKQVSAVQFNRLRSTKKQTVVVGSEPCCLNRPSEIICQARAVWQMSKMLVIEEGRDSGSSMAFGENDKGSEARDRESVHLVMALQKIGAFIQASPRHDQIKPSSDQIAR